ncbi:MAG TPA: type II toxin-antitoxin system VapC family toxin [Methylomirabilota bacterium]|nr:type II toxin-antitoxin system VapC family toxin [Methylomirabilota bacterium]
MIPRTAADFFVDTNVAVAALFPRIAHHRACAGFCDALEADGVRVVCSHLLHLEFVQTWFRLPQSPYLDAETIRRARLGAWDRSLEVRERWMAEGVARLDAFLARFANVVEIPFDLDVWRASAGLMARYRLRSHDAAHAATALSVGVLDFATADDDFRRVPNLRLHLLRDAPFLTPNA